MTEPMGSPVATRSMGDLRGATDARYECLSEAEEVKVIDHGGCGRNEQPSQRMEREQNLRCLCAAQVPRRRRQRLPCEKGQGEKQTRAEYVRAAFYRVGYDPRPPSLQNGFMNFLPRFRTGDSCQAARAQ